MSTMTAGVVVVPAGQSPQTYDFTKRKRWADLLLTELVDNIVLVLSVGGKILYCGKAVTELLGWRDVDLVDVDFVNLIDEMDQTRFLTVFNDSLNTGGEFNTLLHLRHKDWSYGGPLQQQQQQLFDLKCYPHIDGSYQTRCFFGMAAPYPSRNIAMLNTVLDLKAENIRLQHMIAEQRARLSRGDRDDDNSTTTKSSSIYATSSLRIASGQGQEGAYFPSSSSLSSSNGQNGTNVRDFSQLTSYGSESVLLEELQAPEEEGSKKKKLKRTHNQLEQYVCVTCGRTESPEWRKGPAGPKTLCNACGLRWAKQLRKVDEPVL